MQDYIIAAVVAVLSTPHPYKSELQNLQNTTQKTKQEPNLDMRDRLCYCKITSSVGFSGDGTIGTTCSECLDW